MILERRTKAKFWQFLGTEHFWGSPGDPGDGARAPSPSLRPEPKKTGPQWGPAFFVGGVDGTRTRDPRRDRPVF